MDSLFKLTGKAMQLIQLASSSDEEDRQVFADTLEGVMGEIEAKADDYAYVMTMIKGKADIVSAEIDRLKAIESALNASYKRMNDAMLQSMHTLGKTVIETDLHTFKEVNNGGQLPLIVKESEVPAEYTKIEIKQKPDNDKIREALKQGKELDFAKFGERGTHLKID